MTEIKPIEDADDGQSSEKADLEFKTSLKFEFKGFEEESEA